MKSKTQKPKGTHGGYREGSGPKVAPPLILRDPRLQTDDPVEFLKAIMSNDSLDLKMRLDSAKKIADAMRSTRYAAKEGKRAVKDAAAAEAISSGRFAPISPPSKPKLHIVK